MKPGVLPAMRCELLAKRLERGPLELGGYQEDYFRDDAGMTRRELQAAIEDLAVQGEATVEITGGCLTVSIVSGA